MKLVDVLSQAKVESPKNDGAFSNQERLLSGQWARMCHARVLPHTNATSATKSSHQNLFVFARLLDHIRSPVEIIEIMITAIDKANIESLRLSMASTASV